MSHKKNVFAIIGSASRNSANEKLVNVIAKLVKDQIDLTVFSELKEIPHFDPELSVDNPPAQVLKFRNNIDKADGVIICTPEYIFCIPGGLKNAIEWCVSTTVFSDKCVGLITASANGQKGHEELQMIMKTLMASFTDETTLLIQGVKGKINDAGEIADDETKRSLVAFINAFKEQLQIAPQ